MAESLTSSAPGTFNTGSPSTIGNAFSPTGSPPIIVAFLAVGLFVAGMLSVRFWRLNRARGTIQEARSVAAGGRVVGEKPVLWDLWLDEPIKSRARWGDIMPLSVSLSVSMSDIPEDEPYSPGRRDLHPIALRYHELRTQIHAQQRMKQPPVTTPQALLQVAIPIALPSPRRQSMGDSEKGYLNSDEGFEYSIGLVDLPWHAESLTGGMND